MKQLLYKEWRLAMHPTALLFLGLSLMLLIPNYPYYVTFFYTTLGIFFICVNGRENRDITYMMLLPIRKRDLVTARFLLILLLEGAQVLLAIPVAMLRNNLISAGNAVGMDANVAFFGLALVMLGLFNNVFLTGYYRDVNQVGKPFVISSTVIFLYMAVVETLTHVIPFFRDRLDTKDPLFLPEKLLVLAVGLLLFALLNLLAWRRSVRSFETQDL